MRTTVIMTVVMMMKTDMSLDEKDNVNNDSIMVMEDVTLKLVA